MVLYHYQTLRQMTKMMNLYADPEGVRGVWTHLENYKLFYIFLEILVQNPLDPIASWGWSIRPLMTKKFLGTTVDLHMPLKHQLFIYKKKIVCRVDTAQLNHVMCFSHGRQVVAVAFKCGSRGEGAGVPDPLPGKTQVIWVSIGNKQLDPPLEKFGPPLENVGPPLEP